VTHLVVDEVVAAALALHELQRQRVVGLRSEEQDNNR
jgi:hypothetical protein